MEGFKKRREDILNVFSNAQKDLEQLNAEIDAKIADNNETSIKTFAKFFK